MNWYDIENIDDIDSPSLVLYEDRLDFNFKAMLELVKGDAKKLMPHVKTNKMPEVIKRMVSLGIKTFKASTIAEAEIAAEAGAKHILIAHQLVGPKIGRFFSLIVHFPKVKFSTILDNIDSMRILDRLASERQLKVEFYIDINSGMNRSGITLGSHLDALLAEIPNCKSLFFKGFHVYDGHLRQPNFETRKNKVEEEFKAVENLFSKLKIKNPNLQLICGGTPSFTAHLSANERVCSPGTCVFWDWGYGDKLIEQPFKFACLVVTRVISKPTEGILTIDMGHKSVGAENPIHKRIKFLNLSDYELLSQSEEHGVLKIKDWDNFKVGDVLFGVPYHICPTINLHDEVSIIRNRNKAAIWQITARKRKINF